VLPDDHLYVTGGVGYLGARPSQQVFDACDTLLIVGSGFPYIEYYPKPGQVRAVQIDLDAARIGLRYPIEAAIVGDAGASLRALNHLLQANPDRSFLEQAQAWKAEWLDALKQGAEREGAPMKPQRIVHGVNARLAADAVITTDCGQNTGLAAQYIQIREGQSFGVSGTLASMGGGLPYAIAAALAFPGRQVVAIVGDGGFTMTLGELATAARYGLPIKIVVLNNGTLGQIKWEQMLFLGNPEFACELAPVDFAKAAEAFGVKGIRIEEAAGLEAALDEAFAHSGPVLLDAVVDSDEPMLPPKRREPYMEHLKQAFEKGTPGQDRIEQRMREEPALISLKP
jgi:pyruvate dehydrogenase (quinone)